MSIYNEDELNPPSWLNNDFMLHIMKNHHNEQELQLLKLDVTPATLKGDHYASVMFRVKVQYNIAGKQHEMSVIVKTMPECESLKREFLQNSAMFETEIKMYTLVLPLLEGVLRKFGDETRFGPKVLHATLQPRKVIVFEDLCEQGYDTIRDRDLTLAELKLVYQKLAKLHAASYILAQTEQAELITGIQDGLFSSDALLEGEIMLGGLDKFLKCLREQPKYAKYADKLSSYTGQEIIDRCKDLYRSYLNGQEGNIYVLNHGDFHKKNFMFKFEGEQLVDIIMVDYQLSVYAPSTVDLHYATYMLYSSQIRQHHTLELQQYYFEQFSQNLQQLECKSALPKYSQFQISNLRYRHFAIYLLCSFLPMNLTALTAKPEDMKDVDSSKLLEDSNAITGFYKNPAFLKELEYLLPHLLQAGYLD